MKIKQSTRFKRDLKAARKRGLDMDILDAVVELISQRVPLPAKYQDHHLVGNYAGFRECHIAPDWLLIYRIENDEVVLYLFRTGTHSDLF